MSEQEVEDLAASLAAQGFIHPLVVRAVEGGRYEILSGHQRLRAAQRLGREKVPCRLVQVDDVQAELMLLDANLAARQLGPMELARAIRCKKQLLGERRGRPPKGDGNRHVFGRTRQILAEHTGLSPSQVGEYDALNELIPEIQALVEAGILGVSAGSGLGRLPEAVQRMLWEALGDSVGQLKVEEVRRLREDGQRAAVLVAALTARVEELETRLKSARQSDADAGELQAQLQRLRAQKRELEYEIQDRLAARRQLDRRPGARLLELVTVSVRPLAQAQPEITALVDNTQIDAATAANLKPHVDVLVAVANLLAPRVNGALACTLVGRQQRASK